MAPTYESRLHIRTLDSTKKSSIALGATASVIIAIAVLWSCVWPWFRKRYVNARFPARTRWRDDNHISHPLEGHLWYRKKAPMFPTHPALLRTGPSHRLEARSPVNTASIASSFRYDHRHRETMDLPFLRPGSRSTAVVDANPTTQSLFTPTMKRFSSIMKWPMGKSTTMPRTQTEYERARSLASDHAFGDAKEYILAVPEPLLLRNRSPISDRIPATKLRNLSQGLPDTSHHQYDPTLPDESHAVAMLLHSKPSHPLSQPAGSIKAGSYTSYVSEVSTFGKDEDDNDIAGLSVNVKSESLDQTCSVADLSESDSENAKNGKLHHSKSIAALNRLKTYRSLTGAKPPRPLTRAGTLTRPKTPVAEIRNLYDRTASHHTFTTNEISHADAFSIGLFPAMSSPGQAPSTLRTSLDITSNSSGLLPTPLQTHGAFPINKIQIGPSPPDTGNINFDNHFGNQCSQSIYNCGADVDQEIDTENKVAIKSPFSPHGQNLASCIPVAVRRSKLVRPVVPKGSMQSTLLQKRALRSSSLYSRDTRGISIYHGSRKPTSAEESDQTFVVPHIPNDGNDQNINNAQGMKDTENHKGMATDAGGTKTAATFGQWQRAMQTLAWHTAPSSSLRHALSDVDPEYLSSHSIPNPESGSETSTISTEMNSVDAAAVRDSIARLCIRESTASTVRHSTLTEVEAILSDHNVNDPTSTLGGKGAAPGGAQWI